MTGTQIVISFLGAVALLLWGVRMVQTGITRAFGATLRHVLAHYVRGPASAFFAGLGLTGILQSSTATALLLASFTARGLIALSIALVMMLGANVGTTLVAQVLSFDVTWLWTGMLALGVFTFMATETDRIRAAARIAIGLGLMLLSLSHLSAAAEPLRDSAEFKTFLSGMAGDPIMAFLAGTLITWLMHSSLSMVLLVMAFAGAHAIPVPLALALVLGANVGGAIAPLTGLAHAAPAGRRVAIGNMLMRASVALPFLFLLRPCADLLATLESNPARMVVNFHTAFNLIAALALLPLAGLYAKFTTKLWPDRPEREDATKPKYLDPNVLDTPSEALACAMRETLNMGDRVADMLHQARAAIEGSDLKLVRDVERADNAVDSLHEAIKLYLVKASKAEMSEEESARYIEILTFTTNLEHIGDIVDKNLMELAAKKIRHNYSFSTDGIEDIRAFHAQMMDSLKLAFNVFATRDLALARRLFSEKANMRSAESKASDSHFARLREGRAESIETSSIHLDIIRDLKRIHGHVVSVAYPILEAAGELKETRLMTPGEPAGKPVTP
ncbi:MAG TPA: Na/Pi cotransporter family protein [Pseudolabrys sp.]|nr:Na/Pi cotransporter family protein [Pseudolabrys sp.]